MPEIPAVLFDGPAVYAALGDARRRTGPENVADVLDAVVSLMRDSRDWSGPVALVAETLEGYAADADAERLSHANVSADHLRSLAAALRAAQPAATGEREEAAVWMERVAEQTGVQTAHRYRLAAAALRAAAQPETERVRDLEAIWRKRSQRADVRGDHKSAGVFLDCANELRAALSAAARVSAAGTDGPNG